MSRRNAVWVIAKKIFGLTLILNALITIAAVAGLLNGFYHVWPLWRPFEPYLTDGNLLLIAIAAALINIYPSASISRGLHTGRFLFHHYVYGFLVLFCSSIYVIAFTSVSLVSLFFVSTASVDVNAGKFFILAGLALFLDDLPDVSKRVENFLNKVKTAVYHARKPVYIIQLITGGITFYLFLAMLLFSIDNLSLYFAASLTMGTVLITSLTSFAYVIRKTWLKITPPNIDNEH